MGGYLGLVGAGRATRGNQDIWETENIWKRFCFNRKYHHLSLPCKTKKEESSSARRCPLDKPMRTVQKGWILLKKPASTKKDIQSHAKSSNCIAICRETSWKDRFLAFWQEIHRLKGFIWQSWPSTASSAVLKHVALQRWMIEILFQKAVASVVQSICPFTRTERNQQKAYSNGRLRGTWCTFSLSPFTYLLDLWSIPTISIFSQASHHRRHHSPHRSNSWTACLHPKRWEFLIELEVMRRQLH